MTKSKIKINDQWKEVLLKEFESSYWKDLSEFIRKQYLSKKVFPHPKDIFRAYNICSPNLIKVVILGQDPYHGQGQANGLAFAVSENVTIPPSLKNIFKEIENDLGIKPLENGDLSRWANQGVFLLNSTLTVKEGDPGSHQGYGWEDFTSATIKYLSEDRSNLVFMLWGNYAKKKGEFIDRKKHLVLESTHPSPFSVHNGFFGCRHFSKANEYLKKHNQDEIDWR